MKTDGIKAAYCNTDYLIIISDGTTGSKPFLDGVINPPKGNINGVDCVTGDSTMTEESHYYKIPLTNVPLNTATRLNNVNTVAFPDGANDSKEGYVVD